MDLQTDRTKAIARLSGDGSDVAPTSAGGGGRRARAVPFGEHGTAVTGVEPGPCGPGALAHREGNSVPGLSWARVAG